LIVHQILKGIVEAQMNLQTMGIDSALTIFTKNELQTADQQANEYPIVES